MKSHLNVLLLVLISLLAGQVAFATPTQQRSSLSGFEAGRTDVRGVAATRFVSSSGSDRGRCTQAAPCKTLDRAYQVASPGETIRVAGGTYSATWPEAGAHAIKGPGKPAGSAPITFTCTGPVQFDTTAPNFMLYPGLHSLEFTGRCFRFHVVQVGLGGYSQVVEKITFSGVKMDSFECAGCDNLTIRNSEVGPMVACYGRGTTGTGTSGSQITPAMWCEPSDAGSGTYWASRPRGNTDVQTEPYLHNGSAGVPNNIRLVGNLIHGMQTKDPLNVHTGGMLIWNANGVTMRNNVFKDNAIYDVLVDGTAADWVVENNFFGWPVQPLGNGRRAVETPKDWREFGSKDAVIHRNWLIRYNSFAHGLDLGRQSLANVRVIGNILGNYSSCTPGVSYDSNVTIASRTCGANGKRRSRYPYVSYATVDFHLRRGVVLPVASRSSDASLKTDFDGDRRGAPPDAGADER